MKKLNNKQKDIIQILKTVRGESRKEEIQQHGKLLNYSKVVPSKKVYSRKNLPKITL